MLNELYRQLEVALWFGEGWCELPTFNQSMHLVFFYLHGFREENA